MNIATCPVCNCTLTTEETCTRCGYDRSCDYEQYPTPCRIPTKTPSYANLRARWEQEQARIQSAMEDKTRADRLMKELSQEKARRSEAERRLKKISERNEALLRELCSQQSTIEQLRKKIAQLENERKMAADRQVVPQAGEQEQLREQRCNEPLTEPERSNIPRAMLDSSDPQTAFAAGKRALQDGDYTNALKWYRKASELGHTDAQHALGQLCAYLCKNDIRRYREASELGDILAQQELKRLKRS